MTLIRIAPFFLLAALAQNHALKLHLTVAGGIMGPSFEVDIAGDHCSYRASGPRGDHTALEKALTPAELDAVRAAIVELKLLRLKSEDLKRLRLLPAALCEARSGYASSATSGTKLPPASASRTSLRC